MFNFISITIFLLFNIFNFQYSRDCSRVHQNNPKIFCVGDSEDYQSIQNAINSIIEPGSKIFIRGGEYYSNITIFQVCEGTPFAMNEILPFQTETVILRMKNYYNQGTGRPFLLGVFSRYWKIHNGKGKLILKAENKHVSEYSEILKISAPGIFGPFEIHAEKGDFYTMIKVKGEKGLFELQPVLIDRIDFYTGNDDDDDISIIHYIEISYSDKDDNEPLIPNNFLNNQSKVSIEIF